jgi:DNA-directed RNA polymerase subunit H (RpoH/RPB5)
MPRKIDMLKSIKKIYKNNLFLYITTIMATNNKILKIYKSRKTILEVLEENLGYNVADYTRFSINEIDAMYSNDQLDMLLTNKKTNKKVYIKYYLSAKQIRPQNLDNIIEDLYYVDNILTKDDDLIIITEDEPNETITNKQEYLYNRDGVFVVVHNIQRLQFNILEHELVPKMKILSEDETKQLIKKYNLKSAEQLPQIGRFDPQALMICLRPNKVVEITRDSITAISTKYYRICV